MTTSLNTAAALAAAAAAVSLLLTVSGATAPPASARIADGPVAPPPERVEETLVFDEPSPLFPCADGRQVLGVFTLHRVIWTFRSPTGEPVREVRRAVFDGTQSTEDGTVTAPWSGALRRELDFRSELLTVSGVMNWTRLPGRDALNAGRRVMRGDEILHERGLGIDAYEARVCASLYGR